MIEKAKTFIRKKDKIAPNITEAIHFKDNDKHKTMIGGIVSIMILTFIAYLATRNGYRMIIKYKPYTHSAEIPIDNL